MVDINVVWDEAAVVVWQRDSPAVRAMLDRLAALVAVTMKAAIPVSAPPTVYKRAIPVGSSSGRVKRKGPVVPKFRAVGDFPLRPSGYTRSSVVITPEADGSVVIGPTAPWSAFLNDGTPPHEIRSHGPWPLRNIGTGQVFGPVVHHPGTSGVHFVEKAASILTGVRVDV